MHESNSNIYQKVSLFDNGRSVLIGVSYNMWVDFFYNALREEQSNNENMWMRYAPIFH